jgi:hypothetical protein
MNQSIGPKALQPNLTLEPFEMLIGEWNTVGSHPYFPDVVLLGQASFVWVEGGAFMAMHSQVDHPEFPDGVALFGSDNAAGTFFMLYFDERGVSRKYEVRLEGNKLTWWRDDPHFAQRVTLSLENDGKKLVGIGEMSRDGGEWERDLSLTYARQD